MKKSLTAPLALVKVNGVAIGKMRNIRVTETFRRVPIRGIGQLAIDELPPVEWSGSLNAGFFAVNFSEAAIPTSLYRKVNTVENFVNSILLQEQGVQIDIFKKVANGFDANGIPVTSLQKFASVKGCFITREGFDISESQVAGRDSDFEYTDPIIFQI